MSKKKGGRVTVPKAKTMYDVAPKDPEAFWAWYRRMQARPVTIGRKRGSVR